MPGVVPAGGRQRSNLPLRLTSFVGRSVELAELRRLLAEFRLVTLTGPGGAGKTRLAFETAAAVTSEFEGRTFLVDLAALSRPELLLDTVIRAFPLAPAPSRPLLDALADFLCDHPALVILDNCEHLLDACAELATSLLAACPTLTVLATSREPLGVSGECTFRVPLLSVPDPDHPPAPEHMVQFEAVQLFVDRARLAVPSFSLTDRNAAAVAQICARLDGIPLALELAAAALRTAAISDISARLDQRFRLLAAPGRGSLPRHQTLAALLDWSYALLDPREQAVFRQLGIFPADWTLDAAEAVCGDTLARSEALAPGDALAPDAALPAVLALVNKSLVQVDQGSGRYRPLETVRMYALGKLEGAEREGSAARLFGWCRRLLEAGAAQLDRPGQQEWFLRLEREQPNYRAAMEWAIGGGRAEEAAALALALASFWSARAFYREARDWLERILEMEGIRAADSALRARLLHVLGNFSHTLNDFAASARYHGKELAIWRQIGDPNGIATALSDLAFLHFQKIELLLGAPYAEEGLAMARAGGDPATVANALQILTAIRVEMGEAGPSSRGWRTSRST